MSRIYGTVRSDSVVSQENLTQQQQQQHHHHHQQAPQQHHLAGNQDDRRRSALGDISGMVSNVSTSTAVGASLAKGLAFATSGARGAALSCATKAGLFTGNSAVSLTTTIEAEREEYPVAEGVTDSVDKADAEDPQYVAEYVFDIFRHFRHEETLYLPHPEYMEKQVDLNEKMRGILVDWLVEVHLKYKLKHETLYLAINLIDRFLEKRQVNRKKLQLVGVCGMLIAAKYEEIYPPEVKDFVYITDKAYTREEILAMEITMLNTLEFHLTLPSPVAFLERFAKVNKCDEVQLNLARYAMELCLTDMKMLRYCPSHLAASAIFLSNKLLRRHPAWPASLIKHTRYTENVIKSCAKEMCCLVEQADRNSLTAVRKKYAQQRLNSVSTMVASSSNATGA